MNKYLQENYEIKEEKKRLRRKFRSARADTDEKYRSSASEACSKRLFDFIFKMLQGEKSEKTLKVCIYKAAGKELSLESFAAEVFKAAGQGLNVKLYIPKTMKEKREGLCFAEYKSPDECGEAVLKKGVLGIYEPADEALDFGLVPDFVILPCLAFDKSGTRLGQGGGYYDRYLSYIKDKASPIKIAAGYDIQLSETLLPFEENDVKIDYYITEKSFKRIKSAGDKTNER